MKSTVIFLLAAGAEAVCPNSCSGNGVCGQFDQCTCNANFRASDCSQRVCPFDISWVATPKGDLNFDGDDHDYTVYNTDSRISTGTAASTLITQELKGGDWESWPAYGRAGEAHFYMECANRGLCDRETGLCECFPGYEGYACNRMSCPNDCSGKGVCQSTGYLTTNANTVTDSWYNSAQSSGAYGLWDSNMAMACKCDPGYTGPDCSRRSCPVGDDILTAVDQVYETQFVDIKTTCEGSVDCSAAVTPSASTVLSGSIKLTYTDKFGEEYTTEPIAGVAAYAGEAAHTLAANAQQALHDLPNSVVPATVEVKATYCEVYQPLTYDIDAVGAGGPSGAIRIVGGTAAQGDFKGTVFDNAGEVVVQGDGHSAAKGTTLSGQTPTTFSSIATLADPLCIRLVVNFNGIPGDLADLKVDVSDVKYATHTNAQDSNSRISGTASDSLTVATGGTYSYTAPASMTQVSTAFDGSVTNEASCTSAATDETNGNACTKVDVGTTAAALNANSKVTFYPETKIEITCTVDGGAARSLGIHTVDAVDATNGYIWLKGLIPSSTISASGCTAAKILIEGRSHFAVTGADADTGANAGETGVDMANVMADLSTSASHDMHLSADGTNLIDHASAFDKGHVVLADSTNGATASTNIFLFQTESLVTAGNNAAAASVGTIASSNDPAIAAQILTGDEDFTDAEASVTWIVSGKGTKETAECGARGLCDTESGQCKCFPGYIGLSCSTQASIAM